MTKQQQIYANIQQQLIDVGYDLGPHGVDGKWGNKSSQALYQAQKDGYELQGDQLVGNKTIAKKNPTNKVDNTPKPALKPKSKTSNTDKTESTSKSDVALIQKQLINAGYNLGKSGADGIWGNQSQAALDQALTDGYVLKGNKLKRASDTWLPAIAKGRICDTNDCSQYANDALRMHTDSKGRILYNWDNLSGSAWTRMSGGKHQMVYSGYNDMPYDLSNEQDQDLYKLYQQAVENNDNLLQKQYAQQLKYSVGTKANERNLKAADNLAANFDKTTLNPKKTYMVNMYYKNSPYTGVAYYGAKEGITGTHTGNLYFNPKTNDWHVSHNIHGVIYDDKVDQILGSKGKYGVTAVAEATPYDYSEADRRAAYREENPIRGWFRDKLDLWKNGGALVPKAQHGSRINPVTNRLISRVSPDSSYNEKTTEVEPEIHVNLEPITITGFNPNQHDLGPQGKEFVRGINNARPYMMQNYGWSDEEFANFGRLAINLAKQESDFGRGERYIVKTLVPDSSIQIAKGIKGLYNWVANDGKFPTKISAPSKGLTQIKFEDDLSNPELKKHYRDAGLYSEEQLTLPKNSALATLIRLDHNDKKLKQNTHEYSDGSTIPWDEQHAFMWNAGSLNTNNNVNPRSTNQPKGYSKYVQNFLRNSPYPFKEFKEISKPQQPLGVGDTMPEKQD